MTDNLGIDLQLRMQYRMAAKTYEDETGGELVRSLIGLAGLAGMAIGAWVKDVVYHQRTVPIPVQVMPPIQAQGTIIPMERSGGE